MEFLLKRFETRDAYIRDPDGQNLLHHIAKDGRNSLFQWMVTTKDYNPLVRDRDGMTAWDIAEPSPNLDTIFNYVIKKYGLFSSQIGSDIIGVVHFTAHSEPSNDLRLTPTNFFNDSSTESLWNNVKFTNAKEALRGKDELIWVNLDINDVSCKLHLERLQFSQSS